MSSARIHGLAYEAAFGRGAPPAGTQERTAYVSGVNFGRDQTAPYVTAEDEGDGGSVEANLIQASAVISSATVYPQIPPLSEQQRGFDNFRSALRNLRTQLRPDGTLPPPGDSSTP